MSDLSAETLETRSARRVPFTPSAALAELALYGGPKTRTRPMPFRNALGPDEVAALHEAIAHYAADGPDPGYQGPFEAAFCDAFVEMMGGGYADAVATGTGAVFVALEALAPPKGSEVLISPVTDAGPLNAILYQGCAPVVLDAAPCSYNVGLREVLSRLSDRVSAAILVHAAGEPIAEIEAIAAALRDRGVKLLEDFSQAPGATVGGRRVGTFGDIGATSTMHRKTLFAGASGGVVYARDRATHRRALAAADRGKPIWRENYDIRSPAQHLGPALNWNTDELSCAIGAASTRRLDAAIAARMAFVRALERRLAAESAACRAYALPDGASPFFLPIWVDERRIGCATRDFAEAVAAEGAPLNPEYGFLISDWPWAAAHAPSGIRAPEAEKTRRLSFNLFLNENYGAAEVDDVVAAVLKVEAAFGRR